MESRETGPGTPPAPFPPRRQLCWEHALMRSTRTTLARTAHGPWGAGMGCPTPGWGTPSMWPSTCMHSSCFSWKSCTLGLRPQQDPSGSRSAALQCACVRYVCLCTCVFACVRAHACVCVCVHSSTPQPSKGLGPGQPRSQEVPGNSWRVRSFRSKVLHCPTGLAGQWLGQRTSLVPSVSAAHSLFRWPGRPPALELMVWMGRGAHFPQGNACTCADLAGAEHPVGNRHDHCG